MDAWAHKNGVKLHLFTDLQAARQVMEMVTV